MTDKTNERPNQEVPAEIDDEFNLIDEYSYCQDPEARARKENCKYMGICDLIWDMIGDEKQRIDRFEELKARMENTRQESPEIPDTPNAENYCPSTPDIASNHGDDHVVAQIKPPTPQSED